MCDVIFMFLLTNFMFRCVCGGDGGKTFGSLVPSGYATALHKLWHSWAISLGYWSLSLLPNGQCYMEGWAIEDLFLRWYRALQNLLISWSPNVSLCMCHVWALTVFKIKPGRVILTSEGLSSCSTVAVVCLLPVSWHSFGESKWLFLCCYLILTGHVDTWTLMQAQNWERGWCVGKISP